jgi:FkbM family methyltransferase
MQDTKQTIIEVINHFCNRHSDLVPLIEKIVFDAQEKSAYDANFLLALNHDILSKSESQLRQDLFVLSQLGFKKDGFFVEFGATDGKKLSNSYLLETKFNWRGILVEPGRNWHTELYKNRKSIIDTRCVYKTSHEKLIFNQTIEPELSTLNHYSESDGHAKRREGGKKYFVDTVSLIDLLSEHGAPHEIDYLSIDTEGSEYEILEAFDFKKFHIKIITCEHNYTPNRENIHSLLAKNGYRRKYENISQFDDWYVRE